MANQKNEDPLTGSSGLKELTTFKNQLEKERIRINKEIGNYPPPIPACDVQFNYLLKERSEISTALKLVENLLRKCHTESLDIKTIEAFIETSNQLDDRVAARLRAAFSSAES